MHVVVCDMYVRTSRTFDQMYPDGKSCHIFKIKFFLHHSRFMFLKKMNLRFLPPRK